MTVKMTKREAAMYARLKASLVQTKGQSELHFEATYETHLANAKEAAKAAGKQRKDQA